MKIEIKAVTRKVLIPLCPGLHREGTKTRFAKFVAVSTDNDKVFAFACWDADCVLNAIAAVESNV